MTDNKPEGIVRPYGVFYVNVKGLKISIDFKILQSLMN